MRRMRCVKIVATLGPSSSDYGTIRALFEAGADVFRLNMSHGSHADQAARHAIIRRVEEDMGRPIAILADLQGPKLRVGTFVAGAHELNEGDRFRFDLDPAEGDGRRVNLPHPEIFAALEPGSRLLVNDGKIRLTVDACGPDFADCTVTAGGMISNRKGVNVPDVVLPLAALSDKDRADLEFACELGVDWLALSFVQRAEDVREARVLARGRAAILSKIEKPAAVKAYDAILQVSDGIMVARGDLGVELPVTSVPPIQKRLVRGARTAAKPVIVATQMLESMITAPSPTRAEVSDVGTAVFDGADAVMLSAETAAGQYPYEAVNMMDRIVARVEQDPDWRRITDASRPAPERTSAGAIATAARQVAETMEAEVIATFSSTGSTTLRVARERPNCPILGLTASPETARRMAVIWGVHSLEVSEIHSMTEMVARAVKAAQAEGFAKTGDEVVVTAGVPFGTPGTTNALRVAIVK